LKHFASPRFWECYHSLPHNIQKLADKNFELLKDNPKHPSLHYKKVGQYWSARVGLTYRALAVTADDDILWFWIGNHSDYDKLLG
jgi:mRNA-degrading endonuclease RelE of RelBE toxin-antitoxin system